MSKEQLKAKSLTNRIESIWTAFLGTIPKKGGWLSEKTQRVYKAVLPEFLYKPTFGYPISKDVVELRRLAKTAHVMMITNTIIDEIARLEWDVIEAEVKEVPEEIVKKTKSFFLNPNCNNESFEFILRKLLRDILEIDAGVLVKIRNLKDEFVEMYAYDGGVFTKNNNIFGILPEFYAYWQYGWSNGSRPIPFNKNEIVYFMRNPRTDSIYGYSAVEALYSIVQLLVYGVDSNLDYFADNNIPKGVLKMVGATSRDIADFQKAWQQLMKVKDASGKYRRNFHKMPVMNTEGKFERIAFSNLELELIEQQKWFNKIAFACFGVTPSELGFTEDVNRATALTESSVFKRKAITPLVKLLEYKCATLIINDLPWIKGKYEDKLLLKFDRYDVGEERAKREIYWGDLDKGLRLTNEIREELGYEVLEEEEISKPTDEVEKKKKSDDDEESEKKEDEDLEEKKALMGENVVLLKEFEVLTDKLFKKYEKDILIILKKELKVKPLSEIKAFNKNLIDELVGLFQFGSLKKVLSKLVEKFYFDGNELAEIKLGMNFVPNPDAIKFIENYTLDLVSNMEVDAKASLSTMLQRAVINGNSSVEIAKEIKVKLGVSKNRAKSIAITELNRANNCGELMGWKQSGLPCTKTVINKNPVSDICKALDGITIDINDKFEYKGKSWDAPPFHVRCKSAIFMKLK